jgi:hypothetical protein
VPHAKKDEYERSVRNDRSLEPKGYANFAVRPLGSHDEHFVIDYVEPMAG